MTHHGTFVQLWNLYFSVPMLVVAAGLLLGCVLLIAWAEGRLHWPHRRMVTLALFCAALFFVSMQGASAAFIAAQQVPNPLLMDQSASPQSVEEPEYCDPSPCDPGVIMAGYCCWPSRNFCIAVVSCR